MNIWGIMEIEPTSEISIIKKAYAKKLKKHHPEDDPEGYQMLREAYDSALKFAKNSQLIKQEKTENTENVVNPKDAEDADNVETANDAENVDTENDVEDTNDGETANDAETADDGEVADDLIRKIKRQVLFVNENSINTEKVNFHLINVIDEAENPQNIIEDLFKSVNQLYDDFFQRIDISKWEEIFNSDIMWRLDYKEIINKRMISFLVQHHYFPKNIWQFLNNNFHWDEQENYLNSCCPGAFVKYLFKQISQDRGLRYCYFSSNNEIYYEKYLIYRDGAYIALSENDLNKAKHYLSLAYEIYQLDPELLCMKGEYYLKRNYVKKPKEAFEAAIQINPQDMSIRFYQALIYYNNKKSKTAIKICKFILKSTPDDFETRLLLGKCYYKLCRWYKANEIFLENLKMSPSDTETKKYLYLITNKLGALFKEYSWDLLLRHNLKKTYLALGEYSKIEKIKFKYRDFINIFKFLICVIFVIFVIYAAFITYGIALLIVLGFLRRKRIKRK